jgi:hypothetical protein
MNQIVIYGIVINGFYCKLNEHISLYYLFTIVFLLEKETPNLINEELKNYPFKIQSEINYQSMNVLNIIYRDFLFSTQYLDR